MKKTILLLLVIVCSLSGFGQGLQVKGVVTSADDRQPIPGVSIVIKGTTSGITTNIDGMYSLKVPGNAKLVFSFVGMTSQEIEVKNRTTIDVVLATTSSSSDEVVVVGY